MVKNTIIMLGDGMGWEMARAAAIAQEVAEGNQGNNPGLFHSKCRNYMVQSSANI